MAKVEEAIARDIERWARDHLRLWMADVAMRCEVAGAEPDDALSLIGAMMMEQAAWLIATGTYLPSQEAGETFARLVDNKRGRMSKKQKEGRK